MIPIDSVDEPMLREYADKFFALNADSGRFRLCQLSEYVSQMLRVKLLDWHRQRLQAYVAEKGGKPCDKLVPDMMQMPVRKKKPTARKGKRDKGTIDMFGGK